MPADTSRHTWRMLGTFVLASLPIAVVTLGVLAIALWMGGLAGGAMRTVALIVAVGVVGLAAAFTAVIYAAVISRFYEEMADRLFGPGQDGST